MSTPKTPAQLLADARRHAEAQRTRQPAPPLSRADVEQLMADLSRQGRRQDAEIMAHGWNRLHPEQPIGTPAANSAAAILASGRAILAGATQHPDRVTASFEGVEPAMEFANASKTEAFAIGPSGPPIRFA